MDGDLVHLTLESLGGSVGNNAAGLINTGGGSLEC